MSPEEALARALQLAGEKALGKPAPDGPLIGVAKAAIPYLSDLGYELRPIVETKLDESGLDEDRERLAKMIREEITARIESGAYLTYHSGPRNLASDSADAILDALRRGEIGVEALSEGSK